MWNELDGALKHIPSLRVFKSRLRDGMVDRGIPARCVRVRDGSWGRWGPDPFIWARCAGCFGRVLSQLVLVPDI